MSTLSANPGPAPAPAQHRLKTSEYIGYALGDTAANFFFQSFNVFLTFYYVKVWGIPATALLWLIPVAKGFNAINDPIMGLIADRTKTRWGKFRPWILWGAIPYGICGYLMFLGPDLSENGKVIYALVTYSLMLLAYTVVNVPYSSLMGVLSPSPQTRGVASSFRFVGAFSGALLISLFVKPLVKYLGIDRATPAQIEAAATNPALKTHFEMQGYQWTMAIFAVISVVMFFICFATTKERVLPPAKQKSNVKEELGELMKNFPWLMLLIASIFSTTMVALRSGSQLFYFQYVVKDNGATLFSMGPLQFDRTTLFLTSGPFAQIFGTLLLSAVVRKIDKKIAATVLSTVTALSFFVFYFLPSDQYWLLVAVNAFGFFCMGPTSALTWALYGDVADYGEWKFGRRSTGLIFSASLFAIKAGLVAGSVLVPAFLAGYGFDAKHEAQTAHALSGIALSFSILCGIFGLLKAVALFIYPLNQKRVNEIEDALAARRAGLAPEVAQGFPVVTGGKA